MLKKIAGFACITLIMVFTTLLQADEKPGFEAVSPVQPTANADKIEVIEFFWYGCPHCYSFEPSLTSLAEKATCQCRIHTHSGSV